MAEILGKTKRDYGSSEYNNFIFLAPLYASIFNKKPSTSTSATEAALAKEQADIAAANADVAGLVPITGNKTDSTTTKKWLIYGGIGLALIIGIIVTVKILKKKK